jgi:serine protease Do
MRTTFRRMAVPAALVAGFGVAATAMQAGHDPISYVDAQAAAPVVPAPGAETLAQSFRNASRTALQGVVHVQVEAAPVATSQAQPFQGTPFEDFFRSPLPSPGPRQGSGSGFIISPDGYVMTNNHVIENATRVTVTMTDRRQFDATVVGRDPNTDIAVLKIEGQNLPAVQIGNSDELEIGDWVLALGYPLSLGETVTAGIISAKGKSIGIMQRNREAAAPLEHFIQTDAAINPGNSGGPLVNLYGQVVGVNTAIASSTGVFAGYGFAVPITLAKRVADDLIAHGVVNRPRLGVQIKNVEPADIDVFRLDNANGAVVAGVQDGPARQAGLELGDVIVAIDGQPIRDTGELMERVALRQPGERVALDVIRYGDRRRMNVTLGAFEREAPARPTTAAPERDSVGQLGFAASELTPALANQLRIRGSEGVVITQVDRGGPAPQSLIGMRIERLNGKEIRSVGDLRAAANGVRSGGTVSIIGRTPDGEQTIVNYRLRG